MIWLVPFGVAAFAGFTVGGIGYLTIEAIDLFSHTYRVISAIGVGLAVAAYTLWEWRPERH